MLWIAPADEAESNFLGGNLLIGLKFKQSDAELEELDPGEREAILLAECLRADLILLDDRLARRVAQSRNLRLISLLGILDEAAMRELIDLPAAIERLQATTTGALCLKKVFATKPFTKKRKNHYSRAKNLLMRSRSR